MVEGKTLEQVLEELKEAEKEYKEKCLKYGITEKVKRKKKIDEQNQDLAEEDNPIEEEASEEMSQNEQTIEETSEN